MDILDRLAFQFGDVRLSLPTRLRAILSVAVLMTVTRLLSVVTTAGIRRNNEITASMKVLGVKAVRIILYSTAFLIDVQTVGIDLMGLAVFTGFISLQAL